MTPEYAVKKKVKELLDRFGLDLYYYMPVPTGYGKSTVDFLGCFDGKFFAIETKAPGKKPTLRQQGILTDIRLAGGATFVIIGDDGLSELSDWLHKTALAVAYQR